MALLGSAALAMWWNMAPDIRPDFEDWHTHEHFPERLGVPGFRRASRWRSATGGEGFFVMYELQDWTTLSSPGYLARLNQPTPWSTRLMPHHRNMVRSQCHVLESRGSAVAGHALTVRLSPVAGREQALRAALKELITALPERPGIAGAHLLQHESPQVAATTEQKIRGNDTYADWVLVAQGYELAALQGLAQGEWAEAALAALGAEPGSVGGLYSLAHSATPADVAGLARANAADGTDLG